MKHRDFMEWQVNLKDLDEEQVVGLLQRLKQLKKLPANGAGPQEVGEDDWLLDGIIRALKTKGWISTASFPRLRNTKGFKCYLQDAVETRKQLGSLINGGVANVQGRTTLAYVVGLSLIYWVQRRKKIPDTAASVVMFACRSVEALEEQFPGYIAANLFHLVIGGSGGKNVRANESASGGRIARAPRGR